MQSVLLLFEGATGKAIVHSSGLSGVLARPAGVLRWTVVHGEESLYRYHVLAWFLSSGGWVVKLLKRSVQGSRA